MACSSPEAWMHGACLDGQPLEWATIWLQGSQHVP